MTVREMLMKTGVYAAAQACLRFLRKLEVRVCCALFGNANTLTYNLAGKMYLSALPKIQCPHTKPELTYAVNRLKEDDVLTLDGYYSEALIEKIRAQYLRLINDPNYIGGQM